jgi:hypothetical protein
MKHIKKIGIALVAVVTIASCDSPTITNPNTGEPKLIAIKSDNTGNASNVWNLQNANPITTISSIPAFINMKPSDFITSPAGLLGQTTMTWQASAYDNVNKKYAVSIAETIVIYDLSGATVPAPITYVLPAATATVSNKVFAMEYVAGQLFVVQNNEIKKFNAGTFTSLGLSIPVAGINSDTQSNMTKNGTKIYFILKGRLFTFDTALTTIALVPVSGWSADVDYNGLEYFGGKIYCAKRTSLTTSLDKFVSIDLAGTETNIPLTLPYFKDWSRISSAVDPVNRIYYLSSSDGFSTNTNTMTKVDLNTGSNTTSLILGYQFGLQYKD